MTKAETCKQEIKRLTSILKTEGITETRLKLAKELIENASFMAVELRKLKDIIKQNGPIEEYKNGENQYGRKKSAEADVYNTMVKNFSTLYKQIFDLVGTPEKKVAKNDALEKFINAKPD